MQDFFHYAGLSVKLSRKCAEECIAKSACSPKKLYKYIGMKRMTLADLGMDIVDEEMVSEALETSFSHEGRGTGMTNSVDTMDCSSVSNDRDSADGRRRTSKRPDSNGFNLSRPKVTPLIPFQDTEMDGVKEEKEEDDGETETETDKSCVKDKELEKSKDKDKGGELSPSSDRQSRLTSPSTQGSTRDSLNKIVEKDKPSISPRNPKHDRAYTSFLSQLTCMVDMNRNNSPRKNSSCTYQSSTYSENASAALSTFPTRPSSAYHSHSQDSKSSTVPTELLLLRVAAVLKIKQKPGRF